MQEKNRNKTSFDTQRQADNRSQNIFVLNVDMGNRDVKDIARDAAMQIANLFDRLAEEKKRKEERVGELVWLNRRTEIKRIKEKTQNRTDLI